MSFQLDGPYEVALESTGMFILSAVFLALTTAGLSNALQRARKSEDSLKESNRALQHNLEQLAQREGALRESEERFRLLAENVVDILWILDPNDLHFIYVSPSVERIVGYTPAEMMALELDQLVAAEYMEVIKEILGSKLAKSQADPSPITRGEFELHHKNGSTVWVETTARVLYINWLSS